MIVKVDETNNNYNVMKDKKTVIDLVLSNQEAFMLGMDNIKIPKDKPLYDQEDCSSCEHCYKSSKKNFKYKHNGNIYRCKIWNHMLIKENIKCQFYKQIIVSGLQQLIMNTVRLAYPKSLSANSFSEFETTNQPIYF